MVSQRVRQTYDDVVTEALTKTIGSSIRDADRKLAKCHRYCPRVSGVFSEGQVVGVED